MRDIAADVGINIATFSLGRREARAEAVSVIATDQPVPDAVLTELLKNAAVVLARRVEFHPQTATARA